MTPAVPLQMADYLADQGSAAILPVESGAGRSSNIANLPQYQESRSPLRRTYRRLSATRTECTTLSISDGCPVFIRRSSSPSDQTPPTSIPCRHGWVHSGTLCSSVLHHLTLLIHPLRVQLLSELCLRPAASISTQLILPWSTPTSGIINTGQTPTGLDEQQYRPAPDRGQLPEPRRKCILRPAVREPVSATVP